MLPTPVFRVSGEQLFTRFWCGQVPKVPFPFLLLQAQAAALNKPLVGCGIRLRFVTVLIQAFKPDGFYATLRLKNRRCL